MAAGASAAVLPAGFSGEEAQLRQQLNDLSVAPDSAAAALAAAAVSLVLISAADNIAAWDLQDEPHKYEVTMIAEMMLRQVHRFLTGPSCNQMAVDVLSLELPNPVAKLGALCGDLSFATDIIQTFASKCSPRDNVLMLCEALDKHSSIQVVKSSSYFIILLDGIGKVLPLIQRHRAHNIKMAMRAVVGCVKYTISVLDEHYGRNAIALFNAALGFSSTVQEMCIPMDGEEKEEVTTLLGLFALHNIAFISQSKQEHILSACGPLAIGYSQIVMACGFSWLGLLSGDDIVSAIGKVHEVLGMNELDFFSLAMEGAHLAVSWMDKLCHMDQPSMHDLQSALMVVNLACIDKWRAVRRFMYVLSSRNYQWDIKSYSLDLLLSHFHENCSEPESEHKYVLTVPFMMTKAIESIRISVPDESISTKAYAAIKKIIRMVPPSERFGMLHDLLKDRTAPISTGFLLDLVKEDIRRECDGAVLFNRPQDYEALPPCFKDCLDFLFKNLSPPYDGGDDFWGKVLDSLNLLRFLLIRGSNMLLKPLVRRVFLELLAPLRCFLNARPRGNYEELVKLAVDRCMTLAGELVDAPAEE